MSQGTDKNNEEGVIVKILEVASYSNLKQLQGNAVRDDKWFELYLVDDSNWFNDRLRP